MPKVPWALPRGPAGQILPPVVLAAKVKSATGTKKPIQIIEIVLLSVVPLFKTADLLREDNTNSKSNEEQSCIAKC